MVKKRFKNYFVQLKKKKYFTNAYSKSVLEQLESYYYTGKYMDEDSIKY